MNSSPDGGKANPIKWIEFSGGTTPQAFEVEAEGPLYCAIYFFDAYVVEQNVNASILIDYISHNTLDFGRISHIHFQCHGFRTGLTNLFCHLLRSWEIDVNQNNPCAMERLSSSSHFTNVLGSACHKGNFTL